MFYREKAYLMEIQNSHSYRHVIICRCNFLFMSNSNYFQWTFLFLSHLKMTACLPRNQVTPVKNITIGLKLNFPLATWPEIRFAEEFHAHLLIRRTTLERNPVSYFMHFAEPSFATTTSAIFRLQEPTISRFDSIDIGNFRQSLPIGDQALNYFRSNPLHSTDGKLQVGNIYTSPSYSHPSNVNNSKFFLTVLSGNEECQEFL